MKKKVSLQVLENMCIENLVYQRLNLLIMLKIYIIIIEVTAKKAKVKSLCKRTAVLKGDFVSIQVKFVGVPKGLGLSSLLVLI